MTPLGIDPNSDGAGLFIAACLNLTFAVLQPGLFRRAALTELLRRVAKVFEPSRP